MLLHEATFLFHPSETNCGKPNKHQLEKQNLEPNLLNIKRHPHPAHPSHTILHYGITSQTECIPQPTAHKAKYPIGFSKVHAIPNLGATSLGSAENILLTETSKSTKNLYHKTVVCNCHQLINNAQLFGHAQFPWVANTHRNTRIFSHIANIHV